MAITIETPTAEAIFQALQSVPESELARLREMLLQHSEPSESAAAEEAAWHQASAQAAARFFEEEA